MNCKLLLLSILTLGISLTSYTQIRSSLKTAYDSFDYNTFKSEFERLGQPSIDELELAVEVFFELGEYSKSGEYIDQIIEQNHPLSNRIKSIQTNINDQQTVEPYEDPRFKASKIHGLTEFDEQGWMTEDSIIYFSSNSSKYRKFDKKDIRTELPFLRLFQARLNENGFETVHEVENPHKFNQGPICSYPNGYILTRNYSKIKGNNNLKLIFLDSNYNEVFEFPFNDISYSLGHATFDSIRNRIIFASDMPIGNGETDLWSSELMNGQWQTPQRLSTDINTSGNEMFPHVKENTLYFSSTGHNGYGGLDIYNIRLDTIDSVYHYPAPINSKWDDFGLFLSDDKLNGYLSSNRDNGSDDIFQFSINDGRFGCDQKCANQSCYQFIIEDFQDIAPNRYTFEWNLGDNSTSNGFMISHCYKEIGEYNVSLNIIDNVTGEVTLGAISRTVHVESKMLNNAEFLFPEELHVGDSIQVIDKSEFDQGEIVSSLWEYSNGRASDELLPRISFSKPGYYRITRNVQLNEGDCCYQSFFRYVRVVDTISGNSDGSGSNPEDLSSSQFSSKLLFVYSDDRIAKNASFKIIDELGNVAHEGVQLTDTINLILNHETHYNVVATDVSGKEYFFSLTSTQKSEVEFSFFKFILNDEPQPILIVIDNDENPIDNVKFLQSDQLIQLSTQQGELSIASLSGQFELSKPNYWPKLINLTQVQSSDTLFVVLESLDKGNRFQLDGIHFDLDKSIIRDDAAIILDHVVKIMNEYPSMQIQLSAHTDSRGSDAYNLALSKRRARSTVNYLIKSGISPTRLQSIGKGETELVNHCKNGVECEDEVHEENRRVDVKIIKMK